MAALSNQYCEEKEPEEYTIFCVTKKDNELSDEKTIAALMREEKNPEKRSKEEVDDATKDALSYTPEDKTAITWEAALIIEPNGKYEDLLMTIELALLQLLELRVYDRMLDKKAEETYPKIKSMLTGKIALIGSELQKTTFELAKMRIEITEVVEKTMNITKFMGDWYLAKNIRHACEETSSERLAWIRDKKT